jgi:threonine aldolase
MLCGKADFIQRARRLRKRLGGGLRQAGVLAACGIVSLTQMIDRLPEDHEKAKKLAIAMKEAGILEIEPEKVDTNICIFTAFGGAKWSVTAFADAAQREGLLVTFMADRNIRMVTHNDFAMELIPTAVDRAKAALKRLD